jgi:hypothetical protein
MRRLPDPCEGGHGRTAAHSHRHARDNALIKRQPILTVERPREADAADRFGWARPVPWALDGVYCVLVGGEEEHCASLRKARERI